MLGLRGLLDAAELDVEEEPGARRDDVGERAYLLLAPTRNVNSLPRPRDESKGAPAVASAIAAASSVGGEADGASMSQPV